MADLAGIRRLTAEERDVLGEAVGILRPRATDAMHGETFMRSIAADLVLAILVRDAGRDETS